MNRAEMGMKMEEKHGEENGHGKKGTWNRRE